MPLNLFHFLTQSTMGFYRTVHTKNFQENGFFVLTDQMPNLLYLKPTEEFRMLSQN